MKILILTTHFNTGGITSYVLTLSEALVGAGHQVWVASSGGDAVARLQAAGVRHAAINIRTKSEIHPQVGILSMPKPGSPRSWGVLSAVLLLFPWSAPVMVSFGRDGLGRLSLAGDRR